MAKPKASDKLAAHALGGGADDAEHQGAPVGLWMRVERLALEALLGKDMRQASVGQLAVVAGIARRNILEIWRAERSRTALSGATVIEIASAPGAPTMTRITVNAALGPVARRP